MGLLVFYFCLAVCVSFLCSVLEAVLLSLTPSYISAARQNKGRAGKLLEELKSNVERPLAAILSLNTIAHTVGAAGVGAQAQVVFENIPLAVISGVLTLLILVCSEIIPKTLGAEYWRQLAIPSGYMIQMLTISMWPLVSLSTLLSRLITREGKSLSISRAEIRAVADLGHQEGVLDSDDAKMLKSIVKFHSIKVSEIFTPRPVVRFLAPDQTIKEVMDAEKSMNYSRYPVVEKPERILGYALRNEILEAAAEDQWDKPVRELIHKVMVIPEQMPVKGAFGRFLRTRGHMAVVVDEFGSFAGVLTLEDIVETLLGHEIVDEGDLVEDLREYARQSNSNNTGELNDEPGSGNRE